MTGVFEVHRPASSGVAGWPGWRVTLESEGHPNRTFSFDERDGATSGAEAVQLAFGAERGEGRAADGAEITVRVEEIRVVVSAMISPN